MRKSRSLSLVFIYLLVCFTISAQTIISPNIDFNSEEQSHVLQTHKGDQFIGKIVSIHNDSIIFIMRSANKELHFQRPEVKFIGVTGEENQMDDNINQENRDRKGRRKELAPMPSNQLLYSSTALPYRSRGVYRNTMLLVNQVEVQPSDHFSFNIGSFIPAVISLKVQAKTSVTDFIHVGIVVHEHILLFDRRFVTHPYGVITIGDHDQYLNLGFGYWMDFQRNNFRNRTTRTSSPAFSFGGSYNFDDTWRFYTETMVIVDAFDIHVIPSLTLSKYNGRSMFEVGLVVPFIPILSYNRSF